MNKEDLRIRIIPEDGQVLIETHTDGIVKCKEIQEDALLDCIRFHGVSRSAFREDRAATFPRRIP